MQHQILAQKGHRKHTLALARREEEKAAEQEQASLDRREKEEQSALAL
jgi:hypothetical protein